MLKHLELSNPNSCLNTSADDEPLFVICARDPLAVEIIREWAVRYIARKSAGGIAPTLREAAKYHEALQTASLADAWRAEDERNAGRQGELPHHSV